MEQGVQVEGLGAGNQTSWNSIRVGLSHLNACVPVNLCVCCLVCVCVCVHGALPVSNYGGGNSVFLPQVLASRPQRRGM